MADPVDTPDLHRRLVIVGGGPAAARQLNSSGVDSQDVCIISTEWGSGMGFLGSGTMQSYVGELDVGDGCAGLAALLEADQIQPSAAQYDSYVRTTLRRSGATLITGTVTAMTRTAHGLRLAVDLDGTTMSVTAERVVLATGSRPRRPPAEWAEAGAISYADFYRMTVAERRERCRGRSVLVIGSGNSAMQTATLAAPLASDTTVLATRYHGLFPFETADRFAWRSQSALTCELVVKSAAVCGSSGGSAPCVRLLVYSTLTVGPGELEYTYHQDRNGDLLARCSLPPRCRHAGAVSLPGPRRGWSEKRPVRNSLVLWATGCQPVYPDADMLSSLPKDAAGYLISDAAGRTAIPGLYLTGACSGQRAVNEMQPALEARLDDLDELSRVGGVGS